MIIRVLGCSGAIAAGCRTTSFLLDDSVLIDAGTGVGDLTLAELTCIDHILILSERHLGRILAEYVSHFNRGRPHQGIDQRTPLSADRLVPPRRSRVAADVITVPVLGGLHHDYRLAA